MKDTDLRPDPVLFRSRLAGKDVYCNGATFSLEGLTPRIVTYCRAMAADSVGKTDGTEYVLQCLAFGIRDIAGLTDENGDAVEVQRSKVSIMGREYTPVAIDWLERLDAGLLTPLFNEVMDLTNLHADERLRLDFTKPSQPTT